MDKEIEKKLWKKTKRFARILQIVPFVEMVCVCNNLSFNKVDEKSDIDLFVVAKSGRLFIVRSFITFLSHIFGVRRHKDKVSGRFCLSFFVDEEAMDLSKIAIEHDIYLAYWIKSVIPLIDDNNFADKFLMQNLWAKEYFENLSDFYIRCDQVLEKGVISKFFNKLFSKIFSGNFGDFIENRLKGWQMKRSVKKSKSLPDVTGITITDHILKFHNLDRRREYKNTWFRKYGAAKLNDEKFISL